MLGHEQTSRLDLRIRDKYENLILLCRNCHRKVDTLKRRYPDERLLEIKASHEAWVRTALPERGFTHLRWKVLRLQGDFPFDPTTIAEALSPDQEASVDTDQRVGNARFLGFDPRELTDSNSHHDREQRLGRIPCRGLSARAGFGLHLRRIPADKSPKRPRISISPRPSDMGLAEESASMTMPTVEASVNSTSPSAEVFFLFELTAPIDASELLEGTGGDRAVYRCSVPDLSTGWLKSKTQLDELARKAREMFEAAAIRYPRFASAGTFSTRALLRAEWWSGNSSTRP